MVFWYLNTDSWNIFLGDIILSDLCVFQLLLKAIVYRIKKCLDDDIFMPLYPKQYVWYYVV